MEYIGFETSVGCASLIVFIPTYLSIFNLVLRLTKVTQMWKIVVKQNTYLLQNILIHFFINIQNYCLPDAIELLNWYGRLPLTAGHIVG